MKDISRREFIKAGAGAVVLGAAASACKSGSKKRGSQEVEVSEGMPLRTNPNSGDKVSLLGYGKDVKWTNDGSALEIETPESDLKIALCFKVEFEK